MGCVWLHGTSYNLISVTQTTNRTYCIFLLIVTTLKRQREKWQRVEKLCIEELLFFSLILCIDLLIKREKLKWALIWHGWGDMENICNLFSEVSWEKSINREQQKATDAGQSASARTLPKLVHRDRWEGGAGGGGGGARVEQWRFRNGSDKFLTTSRVANMKRLFMVLSI